MIELKEYKLKHKGRELSDGMDVSLICLCDVSGRVGDGAGRYGCVAIE